MIDCMDGVHPCDGLMIINGCLGAVLSAVVSEWSLRSAWNGWMVVIGGLY